ncbi:Rv2175c family DNA-binding protein [Actinomyces polynesiensis]|uniref:Rv2175c family DNA-binding protein n=1 Tax=Actinomyces polynesiensis TaxID=1325934 RepID=UPI0006941E00|nr:Rv2175c family DNA-binding protein [Actinomyces polynesiensis]
MDSPTDLLTIDEAARRLGIEPRRIKQLVRDRQLFLVTAPDGSRAVPAEIITQGEHGWEPLWNLPGTLTLLADGGFSDEEAVAWLHTEREELGGTPMEALLAGRHHLVNTIAGTLAF